MSQAECLADRQSKINAATARINELTDLLEELNTRKTILEAEIKLNNMAIIPSPIFSPSGTPQRDRMYTLK